MTGTVAACTKTGHYQLLSAPFNGTEKAGLDRYCNFYRQRQDTLLLLRHLLQIIKSVQRHRGMSMALLGGNGLFQAELERLQRQLERRFLVLQTLAQQTGELLSPQDQDNLHSAWITISHNWQEDTVIDNYELHCHLVEQLLTILGTLGKLLEQPIAARITPSNISSSVAKENTAHPARFRYLELLHFTTRQMPTVIEQIGRVRALATYAAALGRCDSHHDSKLRYVMQCTRVNNEKLRHQAKRLAAILEQDSGLLQRLKSYEIKLAFLLNLVEQEVLSKRRITIDSHRIFIVSSDIIDVYFGTVEEGVHLLSLWHEEDLENWLGF